jgi:hypothetical protein
LRAQDIAVVIASAHAEALPLAASSARGSKGSSRFMRVKKSRDSGLSGGSTMESRTYWSPGVATWLIGSLLGAAIA